VLCQSTQNLEKVTRILEALRARIRRLEFFNTICSPTRIKQQEIKTMPLTHDVMVIIGSRSSANTRRLFEISKSLNPKSHWIANARELKTSWFAGASRIGISSGSSTPDETTQEVVRAIKNYFS
jgi:4-hydroxy-3-methylbut-2-enyl diphosphate reductase